MRADVHHLTQPIRCKAAAMFLDEPKPHGFWFAKNWAAFLGCPSPRAVCGFRAGVVHSQGQVRDPQPIPHPHRDAR
jgi:hypothetical protein